MSMLDPLIETLRQQLSPSSEKSDAPTAATGEASVEQSNDDGVIVGEGPSDGNPSQVLSVADAAREYVTQGWVLVPIEQGSKGPRAKGWNTMGRCVTSLDQCGRIKGNVGLAHAYSRTCVIDLDALDLARAYLAQHSINLDALMSAPDAVCITSGRPNRGKLLYRLPDGVMPLASKQLKSQGVELRCATADGLTVQDVLPPSIHPDTGEAYRWGFGDASVASWSSPPILPAEVLALWQSLLKPGTSSVAEKPLGLGDDRIREVLAQKSPDCGYADWIGVGMSLHHETRGDERGLELWDEWSAPGRTYKDRADLARHWGSFGRRTAGSLMTMGRLVALLPSIDDMPDLTEGEPAKSNRFRPVPFDEFVSRPAPRWLIKGVLPQAGLVVVYGAPGSGKTFAVLDMVASIARGVEWRGRKVQRGDVVYVCAEGEGGFQLRAAAYAQAHKIKSLPLSVVTCVPNMLTLRDVNELIEALRHQGNLAAVVLDTLARVTPGANENSSEDMGKALAHCQRLHDATGALVILVHHSGKDDARGARGWSGIKGAADTEIEVLREGERRALRVSKQKDGEDGQTFNFKLGTVVLGVDEDLDEIASCVVEHDDSGAPILRGRGKLGGRQKLILRVLHELLGLDGDAVKTTDLIDESVNQTAAPEPGKRDQRRSNILSSINKLAEDGHIRIVGDRVSLPA